MRIIKPYGRTVVNAPFTIAESRKRQLEIGARARETTKKSDKGLHNVDEFLSKDACFFIAQWASMLDKLLYKPQTQEKSDKPSVATYNARDLAGKEFFTYWEEHNLIPTEANNIEKFKKKWFVKVHPYGENCQTETNEDRPKITKRWYKVLGGDSDVEKSDWGKIASEVDSHLNEKQKTLSGKFKEKGLIEARAYSITKNAKNYALENDIFKSFSANEQRHIETLSQQEATDWDAVSTKYSLKLLIDDLVKQEQASKYNSLSRQQAIACYKQHYARCFGETTKIIEAKKQQNLWLYHCMIKEALYFQYPKFRRKTQRHSIDVQKLHNLAVSIENNKLKAFAIRLGKVIHYEGGIEASDSNSRTQIISSLFWTSKGQTKIKQNESFVRQWLGAIAIASTTLDRVLNPHGKVNNDLLVEAGFKAALESLNQPEATEEFDAQFKLLFGKKQNFYAWSDTEQRLLIIKDLRNTLKNLRHASFHFKKIEDFNDALKSLENETSLDVVNTYINRHQNLQQNIILTALNATQIEKYLSQNQVDKLIYNVQKTERNLFPLPKFNKLLLRATNTRQWLIQPANAARMKHPAYQCCFISLKMLYDRGFSPWLEQQNNDCLNGWIKQAQETATEAARRIVKNDDVLSKMSHLRALEENETLLQYFSYLTSETAIEFQVQQQQNSYQSNPESAKEQSNFVEQFKQDVLILGFIYFLKQENLNLLCKGFELVKNEASATELPKAKDFSKQEAIPRPWLYLVLHLMPVEFVNQLALQIKKHRVLAYDPAQHERHEYDGIYQSFTLFLDVHDAILDAQSLNDETKLMAFYKHEEDFTAQFKQNHDDTQLIPVRGLREILRFGNLHQLDTLFKATKVEKTTIDKLNIFLQRNTQNEKGEWESDIAIAQQQRTKLHAKLSKQKNKDSALIMQYKKQLKTIVEYRELKNQVYLHNPKQAHQLMMATLARLVGYSQLWERDIYFTLLALFMLRQIKHEQYSHYSSGEKSSFKKWVTNGQIFPALRKMSSIKDEKINKVQSLLESLLVINKENITTRNNLAHFNSLRDGSINLTDQINAVRQLVSYDRKLKNAVSKSIIELLERHNLIIKFNMSSHNLNFSNIIAKSIYHLEDKSMEEKLHSDTYVEVIKQLFKS